MKAYPASSSKVYKTFSLKGGGMGDVQVLNRHCNSSGDRHRVYIPLFKKNNILNLKKSQENNHASFKLESSEI